jgi:hypothetical protein
MRSSFAVHTGLQLAKSPNYRERAARRRLVVACALLGLALASGVIGSLTTPRADPVARQPVHTGPFSYFPSE